MKSLSHEMEAGRAEGEDPTTNGCIKAFARTKAERDQTGDPRLSIEERYLSHQVYIGVVNGVGKSVGRANDRTAGARWTTAQDGLGFSPVEGSLYLDNSARFQY